MKPSGWIYMKSQSRANQEQIKSKSIFSINFKSIFPIKISINIISRFCMKKILIEILILKFTFQINSWEDQNLDCNHYAMLRVGPHLCERRLFSEETEKFCVHVLVNQFCHSDAKFHLYRRVCSLKWWFPLSKTPFCKVGPVPLKNKRFLQSSLFSSKHSLLLQRQHFGDNKRFFKEQACKTNLRNKVHIKDQTFSLK